MKLEAVIKDPQGAAKASVIWLHGLGADGHDFADVVPMLKLEADCPIRFVFPHAPHQAVTINQGMMMPAWYDILSLDREGEEDEKGIRESSSWIEALIAQEEELGIPSDKIFLFGFSQGGALAVYTSLRHAKKLAGCAVLSGYMPVAHSLLKECTEANQSLPLFIAHGVWDPVVTYGFGKAGADFLEKSGWPVDFHSYPMAHEVCLEELEALGRWMQAIVQETK